MLSRMSRDQRYLGLLQEYYARHHALPSYAGIGALVGLKSKSSVAALVARLRARGLVDMAPGRRLVPAARFFERPLAGHVRAGFPSPATDALSEVLRIDEYLVEHPSQTVLVEVRGRSMIGAGIYPGDIAIVERGARARPGDIVVAVVDGEFTLKFLERDGRGPYLRPASTDYPVIRPEGELEVLGVVVGMFRKYRR